uniref:DUF4011 domain-containing protein n=1 Tax=Glutamicibacter protophormiae TaxID=37930 RepID=UPI003A91DD89
MTEFDANHYIESTLADLSDALLPYVRSRVAEVAPELSDWTDLLQWKDRKAGRHFDRYNPKDLSLLLRMLTENLGTLGYPFAGELSRQATSCASELRNVRNKWAHREEFTPAETYRALDSAEILLTAAAATAHAETVAGRKREVLTALAPQQPAGPPATHDSVVERASDDSNSVAKKDVAVGASGALTVDALPVLSYAQSRSKVAVVDQITIDYRGPELRGSSVEVEAVCQLGSLGDPKVTIVDLDGTRTTTLRDSDLLLDPARMMAVETPTEGRVHVTLRSAGGDVIIEQSRSVDVLAANQWVAQPLQLGLELLAAFVQPNSTAIPALLLEASDLLLKATGNSALDGYQQGSRERVDAIVASIYEGMRNRDIRYAEPPASWGIGGQKVRTPEEVLVGRLGTCLGTTLTLAAALEEAGINSTLWLMEGHIFLGYWRDDASLDGPAQTDVAEVINYVGLGQIGVVETTMLTGGATSRPFADAARRPHTGVLAEDPAAIIGVVDVMQARLARIYPLPSRSVSATGDVTIHEYQVAASPDALQYSPYPEAIAGSAQRDTPSRVAHWKNALLDLSLRNRLINFGETAGYPLAVPQPSLPDLEDMINGGISLTLVPDDRIPEIERGRGTRSGQELPESTRASMLIERKQVYVGATEATYTTRLRALAYKARTIIEETGANNLYLAFGMLRWVFNDRDLRSPLVLVPVTLETSGRGASFRIAIDEAGESTPNYCLLEKLRVSFGLTIPGLAEPAKDDSGVDLAAAFAATRRAIATARLPFTVEDTVHLSILQFAKFRLWKDLDENWDELASNALVSHLIHTPNESFTDPQPAPKAVDLDALGNAVPVPADSSQLDAIAEATADRTFVLEGPPGTGKSQTITNLLANALANGKRVLFVAEKRAALDVVRERLNAVGLAPFSLNLHDKGARPNVVRAQIKAAIEAIARPDGAALKANMEAAETSRGSLQRYAERLHNANAAGLSLYSARAQLLASAPDVPALRVPASIVADSTDEQLNAVRHALRHLPETADLAHPTSLHPWGFVDAAPQRMPDTNAVHGAAQEFDVAYIEARSSGADPALLARIQSPEMLERWAALAGAPRYPLDKIDAFQAHARTGEVGTLLGRIATTQTSTPPWSTTVAVEALEGDIRAIHDDATAADGSGFFGPKKRQRAALARYGDALLVDPKRYNGKLVSSLTSEVLQTGNDVERLRAELSNLPITVANLDWNPYLRDDAQRA